MRVLLNLFRLSLLALPLLVFSGCEPQGPAEEAGENIDEAAEEVGDEVDDATDDE